MKRFLIGCLVTLMLGALTMAAMPIGCAALPVVAPIVVSAISSMLATAQTGYNQAVAKAQATPDPKVVLAMATIDQGLQVIGLLTDLTNPNATDIDKAAAALKAIQDAKSMMGITF